jgi:lipopolysaccharide transport system permease protein
MTPSIHEREVVIRPATHAERPDFRELWASRHILAALAWRNVRNEFTDSYIGLGWVCVRPLLFVLVFTAFKRLSNANPQVGIPYALYLYGGLILWYYVIESATESAGAMNVDAHLLKKVYYPRIFTPLAPVLANLVSLAVAMAPLVVMMLWFQVAPTWRIVLLPLVLLQCVALALGVGTIVASLTLGTRDLERALGFLFYLGLFVSPVVYAPEMIPEWFRPVYALNPFVGTLEAFRATLFADCPFPVWPWTYSAAVSFSALALGFRMFRLAESEFGDQL